MAYKSLETKPPTTKSLAFLFFTVCIMGCNSVKHDNKTMKFTSNGNQLSGVWVKPSSRHTDNTTVIFVHGDGAMDAESKSFFIPMFNQLADNGISSLSWHKAGVTTSSGNWLSQTMQDRAQEVRDAIQYIRQHSPNEKIGVIGFSQAGWVIPYLHNESAIDFVVLVSPAVNWRQQSQYLTWQRLVQSSLIDPEDEDVFVTIEELEQTTYALFKGDFSTYRSHPVHQHPFKGKPIEDPQRFSFVKANIDEDATENLALFEKPILAIFGDSDLNVDVEHSQEVYNALAENGLNISTHEFTNASHQLLKADEYLTLSGMAWYTKFNREKQNAFTPGFLDMLVDWIKFGHKG